MMHDIIGEKYLTWIGKRNSRAKKDVQLQASLLNGCQCEWNERSGCSLSRALLSQIYVLAVTAQKLSRLIKYFRTRMTVQHDDHDDSDNNNSNSEDGHCCQSQQFCWLIFKVHLLLDTNQWMLRNEPRNARYLFTFVDPVGIDFAFKIVPCLIKPFCWQIAISVAREWLKAAILLYTIVTSLMDLSWWPTLFA